MAWADNLEMLNEVWEATGEKPVALANRPELTDRWHGPHIVWAELSGSRNYTAGGVAEIPFSEFFLWAVAHEYTKAQIQSMWEDLHLFDHTWVRENQKRAQKDREEEQERQRRKVSSPKNRL